MTNEDTEQYDLKAIHDLILDSFTDKELKRFFRHRPKFRAILNRFGSDFGFEDMIDVSIEYCEKRTLIPDLLAEIQRDNPGQFARYQDVLGVTFESKAEEPVRQQSSPTVSWRFPDRFRDHLQHHGRLVLIVSVLMLLFVALAAVGVQNYIRQRQTSRFWIERFRGTTSADVRIDSLARLMSLPGQEREPEYLFFEELAAEEQVSLMRISDPDGLQDEFAVVVGIIYTKLDLSPHHYEILRSIEETLSSIENVRSESVKDLKLEVIQWVRGRDAYTQERYQQAMEAYDTAIATNKGNSATYWERGLTHAALGEYREALSDLEAAVGLDGARETEARKLLSQEPDLVARLAQNQEQYPYLATLFPKLTPTLGDTPIIPSAEPFEIEYITFDPPPPAAPGTVSVYACASGFGGVGITLRVFISSATNGDDGTGTRQWTLLKELGVPCFNQVDAPIWNTNEASPQTAKSDSWVEALA
jgi:tetratricopeptide (TPR) repeat protein